MTCTPVGVVSAELSANFVMHPDLSEYLGISTMTLATVGVDGHPHAAPVYFVANSELHLFFFSAEDSQHAQDTAASLRAAAALHPQCYDWQEIRGLQLHGNVYKVEHGPTWEQAWRLYRAKFPFVAELEEAVSRNMLYVFIPHWLRLIDNRQGFGFKQEWTLP